MARATPSSPRSASSKARKAAPKAKKAQARRTAPKSGVPVQPAGKPRVPVQPAPAKPRLSRRPAPSPSRPEFLTLARSHTLVPVYRTLTADLETPVSAFLRLASDEPESFLLESVEGGENVGRYTFIGIRPYRKITARGRSITLTQPGRPPQRFAGDVFALLKEQLTAHTPARLPGLPPFTAGAVGFFSYDVVRQIERLPALAADDLHLPDACLLFFDEILAFDHVRKEILLIVTADLTRSRPGPAYGDALARLARLEQRLARPLPSAARPAPADRAAGRSKLKVTHRTGKQDFLRAVERTKSYIAAGDIFQAVLSQRLEVTPGVDPFSIYRALRIVNPSPYLYFLKIEIEDDLAPLTSASQAADREIGAQVRTPSPSASHSQSASTNAGKRRASAPNARVPVRPAPVHIVGSSPELLVRVQGRQVEYRPIAGTRPRSSDEEEDLRIEQELLHDEKERAEHVMLVDLGRNDVGRVSDYGTVEIRKLMFVERYSHVMHLVSSIQGQLKKGLSAVDAFRACFPAGTLSGAPKIRAMEIIEELEPTRRGLYGGSILYADFSGNLNSCIAIRSMLLKGDTGYIQAGAGIVADSVPEKEYEESLNKAQAVVRAIQRARA